MCYAGDAPVRSDVSLGLVCSGIASCSADSGYSGCTSVFLTAAYSMPVVVCAVCSSLCHPLVSVIIAAASSPPSLTPEDGCEELRARRPRIDYFIYVFFVFISDIVQAAPRSFLSSSIESTSQMVSFRVFVCFVCSIGARIIDRFQLCFIIFDHHHRSCFYSSLCHRVTGCSSSSLYC